MRRDKYEKMPSSFRETELPVMLFKNRTIAEVKNQCYIGSVEFRVGCS